MSGGYLLHSNKPYTADLSEIAVWDDIYSFDLDRTVEFSAEGEASDWQRRIGRLQKVEMSDLDVFEAAEKILGVKPSSCYTLRSGMPEHVYVFKGEDRTKLGEIGKSELEKHAVKHVETGFLYIREYLGAIPKQTADPPIEEGELGTEALLDLLVRVPAPQSGSYDEGPLDYVSATTREEAIITIANALREDRLGAVITVAED